VFAVVFGVVGRGGKAKAEGVVCFVLEDLFVDCVVA
jgi:hypothetical protein